MQHIYFGLITATATMLPWREVVKATQMTRKQGILKVERNEESFLKLRNTYSKVDLS